MMNNFINTLNKRKYQFILFEEWSDIGDKKEYLKQSKLMKRVILIGGGLIDQVYMIF